MIASPYCSPLIIYNYTILAIVNFSGPQTLFHLLSPLDLSPVECFPHLHETKSHFKASAEVANVSAPYTANNLPVEGFGVVSGSEHQHGAPLC